MIPCTMDFTASYVSLPERMFIYYPLEICNNLFFGPIEMESDNIMYKKKVVEDFSFLAGDFQGLCYFSGEYTPLLSCFES